MSIVFFALDNLQMLSLVRNVRDGSLQHIQLEFLTMFTTPMMKKFYSPMMEILRIISLNIPILIYRYYIDIVI